MIGGVVIGNTTMKLLSSRGHGAITAVQQKDASVIVTDRAITPDAAPAIVDAPLRGVDAPLLVVDAPLLVVDAPLPRVMTTTRGSGVSTDGVGALVVKVKPHAEVYVDGAYVGTTPVRQDLSTGSHEVRLVGPEKEEVLSVKISGGKETALARIW
jgi:hypothetical protein